MHGQLRAPDSASAGTSHCIIENRPQVVNSALDDRGAQLPGSVHILPNSHQLHRVVARGGPIAQEPTEKDAVLDEINSSETDETDHLSEGLR